MAEVTSARRYYLFERRSCQRQHLKALASSFRTLQEEQPGTPLPATFPRLTRLAEVGYTTREDLDGADLDELADVGFGERDAAAILAAAAAIT